MTNNDLAEKTQKADELIKSVKYRLMRTCACKYVSAHIDLNSDVTEDPVLVDLNCSLYLTMDQAEKLAELLESLQQDKIWNYRLT
jgi:hypothetical protein